MKKTLSYSLLLALASQIAACGSPEKYTPRKETTSGLVKDQKSEDAKSPGEQQKPGQQSPTHQDPNQQNPIHQNPVSQNPDQNKPGQQNPVQQNPDQHNPGQQNPIQQNPIQQNPVQPNPIHQNPGQQTPSYSLPKGARIWIQLPKGIAAKNHEIIRVPGQLLQEQDLPVVIYNESSATNHLVIPRGARLKGTIYASGIHNNGVAQFVSSSIVYDVGGMKVEAPFHAVSGLPSRTERLTQHNYLSVLKWAGIGGVVGTVVAGLTGDRVIATEEVLAGVVVGGVLGWKLGTQHSDIKIIDKADHIEMILVDEYVRTR